MREHGKVGVVKVKPFNCQHAEPQKILPQMNQPPKEGQKEKKMEEFKNGGKNKRNVSYNSASSSNDEKEKKMRKGPWKPEEDQVLLTHVHKYGPRDWSSIRSKGLLQRTGKSCRLRWVNKLRPNLKSGCKFSAEEEKVVIEMQAEIGNKWATIARQLVGRTDNDVKNFWSSRKKRLARKSHSQKYKSSRDHSHFNQVAKNRSIVEGETSSTAESDMKASASNRISRDTNNMEMIPIPSSVECRPAFVEANNSNTNYSDQPMPLNMYHNDTELLQLQQNPFPSFPFPPFPLETQELIDRLDSSMLSPFEFGFNEADEPAWFDTCAMPMPMPDTYSFFDDVPIPLDIFDQIQSLPTP